MQAAGAAQNAPFTYLEVSLNMRRCVTCPAGPPKPVPCAVTPCRSSAARFYSAVLQHEREWSRVFSRGMQVLIPYAERRQLDMAKVSMTYVELTATCHVSLPQRSSYLTSLDMAKGVIVATSTVWTGDQPNYGTGGDYWHGSPPATAMADTSGACIC